MMISPNEVEKIFRSCLFEEGEDTTERVESEGIRGKFGFHPERLEHHRDEIEAMLAQLPDEFMKSKGGGMSFLNACMTREGEQWTGFHQRMDELFILGQALGKVECLMPREMWGALPGGMPYYAVVDQPAA